MTKWQSNKKFYVIPSENDGRIYLETESAYLHKSRNADLTLGKGTIEKDKFKDVSSVYNKMLALSQEKNLAVFAQKRINNILIRFIKEMSYPTKREFIFLNDLKKQLDLYCK